MKRLHHDTVHFVISDVALVSEVYWVDNLIVAVWLVAIKVLCLPTVT